MTISPPELDTSPYVDLTLDEKTTQDLVDDAVTAGALKWPDWQPLEQNTEVELIELLALVVSELGYRINRLPGAVVETLLALFDLIRDPGTPPRAAVTLAMANPIPIVIPAGSTFTYDPGGGAAVVIFTLDAALAVPADAATAVGAATGDSPTAIANTAVTGTPLVVNDALAYVTSASFEVTSAGRDPETDTAYLNRGILRLRRLVDTLVLPAHFGYAALEDPAVKRAVVLDNYDPAVGPVGDNLGHVTVVVEGPAGVPLSTDDKLDLRATLTAGAHAGLTVHIEDATVTDVEVTATITITADAVDGATVIAATDALNAYLDPDVWPFGAMVYRNELIALVDRTPGVDRVVDLTITGADVDGNLALPGDGPLANAAAPDITVV